MKFTKHIAGEMDGTLIQRCVICSKEISNYQNTMSPAGTPPPRGFDPGPVYISDTRSPRITTIEQPDGYDIINCSA